MAENDVLPCLHRPCLLTFSDDRRVISFLNIEEDREYVKDVGDTFEESIIFAMHHHWAVVRHVETKDLSLIDIGSMEQKSLPPLELEDHDFCFLSSSPEVQNCIVCFIKDGRFIYCHPSAVEWTEYDSENYVCSFIVKENKIYVLQEDSNVVELNIIGAEVTSRNIVAGLKHPVEHPDVQEGICYKSFLVESREKIFLVVFTSVRHTEIWNDDMPVETDVYTIDYGNSKWVQVEDLEDQTFFIDEETNALSFPATIFPAKTKLQPNAIYYMFCGSRSLSFYQLTEMCHYLLLPLPTVAGSRWALILKTMPGLRPA